MTQRDIIGSLAGVRQLDCILHMLRINVLQKLAIDVKKSKFLYTNTGRRVNILGNIKSRNFSFFLFWSQIFISIFLRDETF